MKKTAFGKPILIDTNNKKNFLEKTDAFDEASIQELIFDYPDCLPISDIDEAFNPVIPVCLELNTPVGPLDILMISPNGELIIIETKLWRNPESRRKVVAQILDYAKELSNWTYEDLQREINRKLSLKGNSLYDIAKSKYPELVLEESDFVDSVSRNLDRGKFLLLIVGDGIREGARSIADFLSTAGYLNFSFGMVELSIYKSDKIGKLIVPKTIVKTTELTTFKIEIPEGLKISQDEDYHSPSEPTLSSEKRQEKGFYIDFWKELVSELSFDDPGQPMPSPAKAQNLYLYPHPSLTKKAWISAYFAKSQNRVGVYFRIQNDQEGKEIFNFLDNYKDQIRAELSDDVIWDWEIGDEFGVRLSCEDVFLPSNRKEIKDFFKYWLNHFVNVIRPKIKKMDK